MKISKESRTKVDVLKEMYKDIKTQIKEAEKLNQKLILIGDFNCKVGNTKKGNKDEVSKGGKMLNKMVKTMNLDIINSCDVCDAKWTKERNEEKSILNIKPLKQGIYFLNINIEGYVVTKKIVVNK